LNNMNDTEKQSLSNNEDNIKQKSY
jgi:hypothetical protein